MYVVDVAQNSGRFVASLYTDTSKSGGIFRDGLVPHEFLPVKDVLGLPPNAYVPVTLALPGPVERVWQRGLNYLSMRGLQLCERTAEVADESGSDVVLLELRLDPQSADAWIFDEAILERKGWFGLPRAPERNAQAYWEARVPLHGGFGHMVYPRVAVFGHIEPSNISIAQQWSPRDFVRLQRFKADYSD
ncbi:MAG: hypothetical protein ACMXYM_02925 [Candidatus Woesearchaeota archaeon]